MVSCPGMKSPFITTYNFSPNQYTARKKKESFHEAALQKFNPDMTVPGVDIFSAVLLG